MSVVALREFSLDLAAPLATAAGDIEAREGLLVRVDLGGETGVGEATPLPGWTESLADCRAALERARDEGTPPVAATPAARHAVTLGYRDAFARRARRPVAATLAREPAGAGGDDGDGAAASIPANATVGDASVADTVAAAEAAVESGYRTVKLKIGARSVAEDVERVRTVADAVSPLEGDEAVALRADANGAWGRATAREALQALDGLVEYVEQPLPAADLAGLASLRGAGAPVALDESLTRYGVGEVIEAAAADAVVLKPMALGGPSRAFAAGRAAAAAGVTPVVTTTVDAAVARTAAVHVAAALPGGDERAHGLGTRDLLAADLLAADPVPVEGGRVDVPTEPGLAGDAFDGVM
ncbi:enolase C-terminal domain-like protein [Halobaculum gomorrense]|uniref:o-succinylbenzoate synthase n=1 Tax=Halobaculum gomorrense TaxID=43928 RepID=A0A1M5RDC3_9EURY|nr:enolase C-terminal domain-like protein [Halobaculum gomorrense]SHH24337.1 o-succinylbenzoate synthase [Halobaculum gomorrense]